MCELLSLELMDDSSSEAGNTVGQSFCVFSPCSHYRTLEIGRDIFLTSSFFLHFPGPGERVGKHVLINRGFLNIHFFIRKYVNQPLHHPHFLPSLLRRRDTVSWCYLLLHLLDCATFFLLECKHNHICSIE